MSLISEALKEAQRSHAQRSNAKASLGAPNAFFPYAEGHAPQRSARSVLLLSGVAALVVVLAVAVRLETGKKRVQLAPRPIATVVTAGQIRAPVAAPATHDTVVAKAIAAKPPVKAASRASNARIAAAPTPTDSAKQAPSAPATAPMAPAVPTTHASNTAGGGVRVVLSSDPSAAEDSLFQQAYAAQIGGNFDRAKELYEKAIALPHASAQTFNNYGVLLVQSGNQLEAAEMFKEALARDDKSVDAWINLGDSYNAIGHHAEAMSAYARAAQLDATNAPVKIRLAAEYQAIGDTAGARRTYEDAAREAPKDPDVHYNFGKFLQSQHDYRGAIREYQTFVDVAPGKVSPENIAMIQRYITALRPYAP